MLIFIAYVAFVLALGITIYLTNNMKDKWMRERRINAVNKYLNRDPSNTRPQTHAITTDGKVVTPKKDPYPTRILDL